MSEPNYLAKPVISFKALQRSRTTLEDFAQTYLPLHGLPPDSLFQWLDLFVYVEALIYQMDEDNEALCSAMTSTVTPSCLPTETQPAGIKCIEMLLKEKGYWDDAIAHELAEGVAYWEEEKQLCHAMAARTTSLLHTDNDTNNNNSRITIQRVLETHKKKSFDYRVLHLLLHHVLRKSYDTSLIEFIRVDEMLVDIGDDLVDYEDDVAANSFNIYRAFLHVFGRDADMQLIQRIGELEAVLDTLLQGLPEATQAAYRARQRSDAHAVGSERWVVPAAIWNEKSFQATLDGVA